MATDGCLSAIDVQQLQKEQPERIAATGRQALQCKSSTIRARASRIPISSGLAKAKSTAPCGQLPMNTKPSQQPSTTKQYGKQQSSAKSFQSTVESTGMPHGPDVKVEPVKTEQCNIQSPAPTCHVTLPVAPVSPYNKLTYPTENCLIRLDPEPDIPSDVPECQLSHEDLSSRPLYTAVSYMWVPAEDVAGIKVNGARLKVRKTALTVLRELQRNESRLLWIDAICINQKDVDERSQQVKMIGDVFHKANYVVAWIHARERDQKMLDYAMQSIQDVVLCEQHLTHFVSGIDAEGFKLFFQNDYWSRRWVVQEIARPREVLVQSIKGSWSISFLEILFEQLDQLKLDVCHGNKQREGNSKLKEREVLPKRRGRRRGRSESDASSTVRYHRDNSCDSSEYRSAHPEHYPFEEAELDNFKNSLATRLLTLRNERSHYSHTLRDLMRRYRYTGCEDFRDTVYALRSLSKEARLHLDVDYSIDKFPLLLTVLKFSIEHENLHQKDLVGLSNLSLEQLEFGTGLVSPC